MLFRSDPKTIPVQRMRFDRSDTMAQVSGVAAGGGARALTRDYSAPKWFQKRYTSVLLSMGDIRDGSDTLDELQGHSKGAFPREDFWQYLEFTRTIMTTEQRR